MANVDTQAIVDAINGLSDKISKGGTTSSKKSRFDSSSFEAAAKGLDGVAGEAFKFATTLGNSSARTSDALALVGSASKLLPGPLATFSTKMTKATGAVIKMTEAGIDSWRSLSTSGAAFSNSVMEMSTAAARSRMSLDQFSGMVQENSQALAGMAGSVSEGAKMFAEQSKKMFEGEYGQQLLNMGYSFEEVNEMLLSNMNINRRRYAQDAASRATALASTAYMAKEMDKVAKLTGINRKEMQKEIDDRMRAGNVQAKIRLMEMQGNKEGAEKLKAAYIAMEQAGPGAKLVMEELLTKGTLSTQEAIANASALGPDIMATIQSTVSNIQDKNKGLGAMEGITEQVKVGVTNRMKDMNALSAATLGSHNAYTEAYANLVQNVGTVADSVLATDPKGDAASAVEKQRLTAMSEQTEAADGITSALVSGETALKSFGDVLTTSMLGENGSLRKFSYGLDSLTAELNDLNKPNDLKQVQQTIQREVDDAFRTAGIMPSEAMTSTDKSQVASTTVTKEQFYDIRESLQAIQNLAEADAANKNEAAKVLVAALTDQTKGTMSELIQTLPGATLEEKLQKVVESNDLESIKRMYIEAMQKTEETKGRTEDQQENTAKLGAAKSFTMLINSAADSLRDFTYVQRRGGSLSAVGSIIEDFGKGTNAVLHGKEGVITAKQLENMAMGVNNMMQSVQASPSMNSAGVEQAMSSLTSAISEMKVASSGSSQSSGNEMAEMLNTSLKELTMTASKQFDVAKKQLKTQKGFGGNIFKGIG